MNLIDLIWPAVFGLLLVILLQVVQVVSRSRVLVIVLYVALAIWLAALVVWFWA